MESLEIIAPCAEQVTTVALVFKKKGDRWSHHIEHRDGELRTTILESIEGTDTDPWPPSPPLQEISQQEIGDENVLLAVGMAGRGHWSASFSNENGIQLDWACLDKKSNADEPSAGAVFLGTSYRLVNGTQMQLTENAVVLTHKNATLRMESSDGESQGQFSTCENGFRFQPSQLSPSTQRATRWKYAVRG